MRSAFLTLSFLGMLVILSCQKEYFLETKMSQGTLGSDSAGNCLQSVVNGLYVKDSVVTSSNFIDARINVVTPGEYSIQTETINGLSFKGEGIADSIGLQTVRLFALGNPVEAGIYIFHITYGTSVCAVDITVLATGVDNSEYSFNDSLGTCLRVTVEGTYKVDVALDDFNYIDLDVNVLKEGAYAFTVIPIDGISFSGSGVFTTTGINTIQLSGIGTPLTAGVVEISISDGATDCKYSLEVLPGDNTADAVFALDCSSAVPEGIYKKETALNSENKITIQGTVSRAGRYAITSPVVNGVTFNADATFTSASETPQAIVLTGTGTPTNEGTFDYTVTGNGSTCTFQVTYGETPVVPGILTCKMDGVFTAFNNQAHFRYQDTLAGRELRVKGFIGPPDGSVGASLEFTLQYVEGAEIVPGTYDGDGMNTPKMYIMSATYTQVNQDNSLITWYTSSSVSGNTPNPPFTIHITSLTNTRIKGTFAGEVSSMYQPTTERKVITEGVFDLPIK